jgi:hypothetical protein
VQLHPDLRRRLVEIGTPIVANMQVDKGIFLDTQVAEQFARDSFIYPLSLKAPLLADGPRDREYQVTDKLLLVQADRRSLRSTGRSLGVGHFASTGLAVPELQQQWDDLIRYVTQRMRPVFSNSEDATLLRRCSQWHFDSQCGSNHLLQFVQATVAVEILLGDKAASDVVGLGELLANRYAYSLARTSQQRQEMLQEFKRRRQGCGRQLRRHACPSATAAR